MTSDGSTPLGEPPKPDEPASLREFAQRLRTLREWADVGPRALPGAVATERRMRGIPPREANIAYSTVHNLFQADRKRYDSALLFDTIRALLRQGQPSPQELAQQVEAWRRAFDRARAMPSRTAGYPGFTLGPLSTGCQILEGNGERPIEEDDVRVIVTPVDVSLPPLVAHVRDQVVAEQDRRRAAGVEYSWNAARYAVEDLVVTRTRADEAPEVTLRLKHSDYFTFLATQRLDEPLADGSTLRVLYLNGRDPRDTPDFMRSSFGLNVAVVTSDNHLVVSRRSGRVRVGRNVWNSSANEGLQRVLDSSDDGPPNLFRAAERGVEEELRLTPAQYDLELLAFAVVVPRSQWCCLFLATLHDMTSSQFEENLGRGAQDAWENQGIDFVRFEPAEVLAYILRPDRVNSWAPAAPVLFYLSLVNAHGRRLVDQVVEKLVTNA